MRTCQKCGNEAQDKFSLSGKDAWGRQRFICKVCKTRGTDGASPQVRVEPVGYGFESDGEKATLITKTEQRITNEQELVAALKIDTALWEVEKYTISKSESYRKDRKVDWQVNEGIASGSVADSGKFLIEPIFSVKVWLRRKTKELRVAGALTDLLADVKAYAPKYPPLAYKPSPKKGLLYEIEMPDIHLGRLTWHEESGQDSDLKIQMKQVRGVLEELLLHAQHYHIARILLPLGNDFFNVDTLGNTTTAGTPQQEDTRWQKTFRAGRQLAVEMIDLCHSVAPVDVMVIPGNHDVARSFYLGDALEAWYHANDAVTINNLAASRKYYQFEKVLLGFTHGNEEKIANLGILMAQEVPDLWANTQFREWHIGHLHHKEDLVQVSKEFIGVTVRRLRSLTSPDVWHFKKGFIGQQQASEAFLWSPTEGLLGQFTVRVH